MANDSTVERVLRERLRMCDDLGHNDRYLWSIVDACLEWHLVKHRELTGDRMDEFGHRSKQFVYDWDDQKGWLCDCLN